MKPRNVDILSISLVAALAVADLACWYRIAAVSIFPVTAASPRAVFLDVGQGDSELMIFPGNVKVMTDAGPDAKVLASLDDFLDGNDRYIDLAIITHPQSDHFGGFGYILDHYRVGAFIYNGRNDDPGVKTWQTLLLKIKGKKIPLITLGRGDTIRYGGQTEIDILSPDKAFAEGGELNDTGLVELVKTPQFKVVFTADTGFNVQDELVASGVDLRADILKIAHHGSKYSSDGLFLKAVDPRVAVVEVGTKNNYGHPAKETMMRITSSTKAAVFRTDEDGTIQIWREGGILRVKKGK